MFECPICGEPGVSSAPCLRCFDDQLAEEDAGRQHDTREEEQGLR